MNHITSIPNNIPRFQVSKHRSPPGYNVPHSSSDAPPDSPAAPLSALSARRTRRRTPGTARASARSLPRGTPPLSPSGTESSGD